MEQDLFGRLDLVLSQLDAGMLVILTILLALGVLLYVKGGRQVLLGALLLSLLLSGSRDPLIDGLATLLRWGLIASLAIVALGGSSFPGVPAALIAAYGAIGLVGAGRSPSVSISIQIGLALLLLCGPAASAIAFEARTPEGTHRVLRIQCAAGVIFAAVGLGALGLLEAGSRYSGHITSAPLFALTGAIFLPVTVWWGFQKSHQLTHRALALVAASAILFLLTLSGQRTGTFAGVLGLLPLLIYFRGSRITAVVTSVLLVWVALGFVRDTTPEHYEFIQGRLASSDLNQRGDRWQRALELCLEAPLLGAGLGAAERSSGFGFHNAYLVAWRDGGLMGLLLFTFALISLIRAALRLIRRSPYPSVRGWASAYLGVAVTLAASGFFETKLLSPSNLLMVSLAVVSSVLEGAASWALAPQPQVRLLSPVRSSLPHRAPTRRPPKGGRLQQTSRNPRRQL